MDDEFMDATMQVHAFGLSAGCTFSLDNVPNQLAVLGHFRAMLEMCQNQIEGDPDQLDSAREVENQLRTVKLMIKCAQAKRKAVRVEVMPCILSTSLNQQHDSSEVSSTSIMSMSVSPINSNRGRGRRLPKLEGDHSSGELEAIRNESQLQEEEANSKMQSDTVRSASSKEKASQGLQDHRLPSFNSSSSRPSKDKDTQKDQKQVPTPPTSGSSFSRYLPSFLRKARAGSKDKETEVSRRSSLDQADKPPQKSKSIIDELDLDVKGLERVFQERHEAQVKTDVGRQISC